MLRWTDTSAFRGFARATYFIAFLLVFIPLFDFVVSLGPVTLDDYSWRFETLGRLSGYLLTPLLGLLLAIVIAATRGHPGVARSISTVTLVLALLAAAGTVR